MLSLNHIPKQHTPGAQLRGTFGRGWSHPAVLKVKSDKKIADLRLKPAGGLSSSPLLHYFIMLRQCRKCTKWWACASRSKQQEQRCKASLVTILLLVKVERPTGMALRVSFSSCLMHILLSHWPWQDELTATWQAGDRGRKKPSFKLNKKSLS